MIDPVHVVIGVQGVPAARFVGVNDRAERHVLPNGGDGGAFLRADEGQRPTATFTDDDDDVTLAGLFLRQPTIDALLDLVLGLDRTAEIGAVDFLVAGAIERRLALFGFNDLAQFVGEDKRRFVLTAKLSAQLERAMPLGPVGEDGDCQQVVAHRALAIGEDGSPQWKDNLKLTREASDSLGPPLLLNITPEYRNARSRILVYGKETFGWSWTGDLQSLYPVYPKPWTFKNIRSFTDFLVNEDSIEGWCWAYDEFRFGERQRGLSRTPFWQAFHEFRKWPEAGVLWSNLVRSDCFPDSNAGIAKQYSDASIQELIRQQPFVVRRELEVLNPNICVFFTGPSYDYILKSTFADVEFLPCEQMPPREFAQLRSEFLPQRTFRTYHPKYLSMAEKWGYIEKIRLLTAERRMPSPSSPSPERERGEPH